MKKDFLELAIKAALQAGNKIMDIYQSDDFEIQLKSDDSPLTKADMASHTIIEYYLKDTQIPLLSEEGKHIPYEQRQSWSQLWIVDPIDGTKEFIKRNGEFTVNIALVDNQKPILGVIYAPVIQALYFYLQGMGAYRVMIDSGESLSLDELLTKSQKLPLAKHHQYFTIVASRSHLSDETQAFIDQMKSQHGAVELISKGSSLKLCMVAEGTADCYPRFAPTMEWDTAAGHAICNEAGFNVIDWTTKTEMVYNRTKLINEWFLVN
ncbi:MAG: 3'(2'),5'-bisphosphate nucleotidase CysQ [Bacteroidota bacterium]|nr:3'(2'),5'-bisphosphate nucleotidase CysQ [Bacteroidota bacterium]